MSTVTNEEIATATEGQTVATMFLRAVDRFADQVALRAKGPDDQWVTWTFAEYAGKVAAAAAHLRSLGVGRGDRVVLMFRNTPDFHFLDTATVFCGATPISVYNSSSPEQIAYLAGHCKAKVAVVEDDSFAPRFVKVRHELPDLVHLVNLADEGVASALYGAAGIDLDEAAAAVSPDDLATVIYTSGTTGPPKGVMITHRNVAWTAESLLRSFGDNLDLSGYRLVSYLPMAHIAERMTSHYAGLVNGYDVACCPDPGLLSAYLRDVRPNIMFGVPRVWEKLHGGIMAALAADPERKATFDQGIEAAKPIALARSWGTATDEQNAAWEYLQGAGFRAVREMVGLDQVEFGITGAAPIPRDLLEWYLALGVSLSEIYGMSENCGPMTWTPTKLKPGTVGPACPGVTVTLAEDGEVLCKGGNVCAGYLDDPEKTAEAIDAGGWLHTGDIGVLDEDGYLKIVDRKKELIITAGGKNISPANLEAALKTVALVGQACAIGDQRPFVGALVVLDPEVAAAWAKSKGIEYSSLNELAAHAEVVAEIEAGVKDVMSGFNNAERVKKVVVLGEEWLSDSEELTPTSKLKRRGIHARYAVEIESLYA